VDTGGHGHNEGLKSYLASRPEALGDFQYSILETLDLGAAVEDLLARETHWKLCLGSRATGLNLN